MWKSIYFFLPFNEKELKLINEIFYKYLFVIIYQNKEKQK